MRDFYQFVLAICGLVLCAVIVTVLTSTAVVIGVCVTLAVSVLIAFRKVRDGYRQLVAFARSWKGGAS
jgi:xanthine/uracil/vitamin C permease (AzgA family)